MITLFVILGIVILIVGFILRKLIPIAFRIAIFVVLAMAALMALGVLINMVEESQLDLENSGNTDSDALAHASASSGQRYVMPNAATSFIF